LLSDPFAEGERRSFGTSALADQPLEMLLKIEMIAAGGASIQVHPYLRYLDLGKLSIEESLEAGDRLFAVHHAVWSTLSSVGVDSVVVDLPSVEARAKPAA
jgi:hypothetical protein